MKDEDQEVKPDDALVMSTFVLEKKNNPHLSADVVFDIKNNTITGNLKHHHYWSVPTFKTSAAKVEIAGQAQLSGSTPVDFRKSISYVLTSATGAKRTYTLNLIWDKTLPKLEVNTTGNAPIQSTDNYVPATITLDGLGVFDSFKGSAQIRGRGNSTWNLPKKPYKFKLDQKAGLLGMAAEKDWVLLANYLDGTHLLNAVAMKVGQLMGMPFTNHVEPVELYLNGQYLGLYLLTEQIEVKDKRVDIGAGGVLLQLEQYYDEPWKFRSAAYRLPVMVMHPELSNTTELDPIRAQFEQLEALIARADFPNNPYANFLDVASVADYFLVYMLTDNRELNHPKSTFLYKTKTGKWTMGPIWDFDWAFAYEGTLRHFSQVDKPLLWSPPSTGTRFFSQLMAAPDVRAEMKKKWAAFKTQQWPALLAYVDHQAFLIEAARTRDYQRWKRGNLDFTGDVLTLKNWLQSRANYMDGVINAW